MRNRVVGVLRDYDVDYTETLDEGDNDYATVFSCPVPTEAVQPLLEDFRAIGLDEESHVVVQRAEAIVSDRFEEQQRRYDQEYAEELVAHEEIRTVARGLISDRNTFVLLTVISAVVATAGLLLDSASVVVGSMVIAPLIGPTLATSVGTVLYDRALFREGVAYQFGGFALAIVSATAFALFVRTFFLVPPNVEITAIEQIAGRLSPDLLALVVALGSGAAGARSLEADISTALIGVMMAAALVPPTAAVGIGIAWGLPIVVFRSGLLVLVNAFSINLVALIVLWYSGLRSAEQTDRPRMRKLVKKRILMLLVVVILLAGILGAFTWSAYQAGASSEAIREDVRTVLEEPAYQNLSLVEIEIQQDESVLINRPKKVVVTVTSPEGQLYPTLGNEIDVRIDRRASRDVETQIRFIGVTTAG